MMNITTNIFRMLLFAILICVSVESVAQKPLSKPMKTSSTQQNNNVTTSNRTRRANNNQSVKKQSSGKINGHDYVDLGLSVKWATCNIGASKPSDYGDYYAWGEIHPKSEYTETNSVTYGKIMSDISGSSQYDAARANWGGSWRLPTFKEMMELFDNCNICIYQEGKEKGWRFTSRTNGNSVFFPFAGAQPFGTALFSDIDKYGHYWTSTPFDNTVTNSLYSNAFTIFIDGGKSYGIEERYEGLSIRPVSE